MDLLSPDEAIGLAAPQDQGGFYPLAVGNAWNYEGSIQLQALSAVGTGVTEIETATTHEQTGLVDLGGQSYVREHRSVVENGEPSFQLDVYFRQDKSGLYEADDPFPGTLTSLQTMRPVRTMPDVLAKSMPREAVEKAWTELMGRRDVLLQRQGRIALRPAGSVPEITRFAYPLHPGAEWTIRADPFFGSTVEGRDNLETPAGRFAVWRIRIDSELFDPADEVHFYYGRCGYIGHDYTLAASVTGASGEVLGTLVYVSTERLTGISLVGQGGCGGE